MYQNYLRYWKQILFGLIVLFLIFQVKSENDLLFIVVFIFIGFFIRLELSSPRGIHKAVLNEDIDAVIKYLDQGTDIDLENNQGSTPLILTVYHNLQDVAQLLINRGANVNYNLDNEEKETPLYKAVVRQHHEIVNLLLTNGAVLDLHSAAFLGKIEVIRNYLEQGGDVNLRSYKDKTLLHMAAWNNQLEIAQLFIDSGVEINTKDEYGRTALHFAASHSEAEKLVELLISRGSELHFVARLSWISDGDGKSRSGTPLHIAAFHNYTHIAEILITQEADVNARDFKGNTPLHKTVLPRVFSFDVAELLIANGADINAYEKSQGKTPLHEAAYWGHIDIVELLLANGAKVNFRDFSGRTPLSYAENRHSDIYCLLVECGAKL